MKTQLRLIVTVLSLFIFMNKTNAATYNWVGSSGGNWASQSNWFNASTYTFNNGYPGSSGSGDIAFFYTATTVSCANTLSINSIQTNYLCGNVIISFTGNPTLNMSSFTVGQQSSTAIGLTFTGAGIVNVSSSPNVNYLAGFNIGSGTTINFASGDAVTFNNPPAMSNAGTINLTSATFSSSNSFTNSGILNITGSTGSFSSAGLANSGTVSCTAGKITAAGNIVNSGSVSLLSSATLATNNNCNITSSNNFTVSSSTVTLGQASGFTNSGTIISTSPGSTTSTFNLTSNTTSLTTSGLVSATATIFNLTGYPSYITNTGSFTNNGCNFSLSSASNTTGITNIGTFNALASTQINMSGQGNFVLNSGSSANFILDGSTISMSSNNVINITNQTSAVFTARNNSTINVSGYQNYITNSATFNAGLSGSPCTINISGTAKTLGTNTSIYNTSIFTVGPTSVINNTGTDSSNPTIVYNNGGTFTLLSDNTGSATIGPLGTGASCQGVFNVQRYLTGGSNNYRNYRLLSCPVNKTQFTSGSSNLIDLSYLGASVTVPATYNGAFIAGPGATFGGGIHTITNPMLYLYQESLLPGAAYNKAFTSGKNVGIKALGGTSPNYYVTTVSTATAGQTTSSNSSSVKVPVGNGYIFYYIGSNQRTTVSSATLPDASVITATGYINQGNVPLYSWGITPTTALTNTTGTGSRDVGLQMVGNPYPATLDLRQVYLENSGLSPTFYQLNSSNQAFNTYNAATGTSSTTPYRYVASGQGFYTYAATNGATLTFKEDQKASAGSAVSLLSFNGKTVDGLTGPAKQNDAIINNIPTATAPAGLHLKLQMDSVQYDEIGVYFSTAWADTYDKYDSFDLDGLSPKVYLSSFTSDNVRVSINAMSDYTKGKRVKLFVKAAADGAYTLSMEDILKIDTTLFNVYLVDNLKSDSIDLVHTKSYTFNMAVADTNSFTNRFVLAIETKSNLPVYSLVSFSGQKVSSGVQLNWTANNAGDYTGFVLQKMNAAKGYDSLYSVQSDTSRLAYSFIDQHPSLTTNTYRLQQNDIHGNITYSNPVTIGYNSSPTSAGGALTIYPNPAKSIINVNMPSTSTNAPSYTADVYNTSGVLIAHQAVNSNSWTQDVSSYRLGVYVIQLKTANGYVVSQSKFIKVN